MTAKVIYALAAGVILFFTVWLSWRHYNPDARACKKSVALCKPPDTAKSLEECRNILEDTKGRLGGSIARMAAHCMIESESCNASLSCLSHADRRANELKPRK
jgi:hypothetical protein